jgi:hypothetical protein
LLKSVNSSSEWVRIEGQRPYIMPPVHKFEYPTNPYDGQMIYNFSSQEVMVFSDGQWFDVAGHANIGLHTQTEKLLSWARQKLEEEKQMDELCDKYPALAEAREQFEAMKTLVGKHDI